MNMTRFEEHEKLIEDRLAAFQESLEAGKEIEDWSARDADLPSELRNVLAECRRCLISLHETRGAPSSLWGEIVAKDGKLSPPPFPELIGKIRILERIGAGGFGIVFRGQDLKIKREVAVKIPRPELLASREYIERFSWEAKSVARLDHPNILAVYETGNHGVLPYMVMPFVGGGTLTQWRAGQKSVSPRWAAEIVRQLAGAVSHAHKRGVLHRDIKPGNVLLAPIEWNSAGEGLPFVPKLTDFGLAKDLEEDSERTSTGVLLGTLAYMSPEQASGKSSEVTSLTDVYGLGCTLYTLLAGKTPYSQSEETSPQGGSFLLERIQNEDPAPLPPGTPRDLEVICLKCLRKRGDERYQSAAALMEDLQRYLDGDPIVARPISIYRRARQWCRRNPVRTTLIGTGCLGLFVLGVVSLWYNGRLKDELHRVEQERNRAESLATESRSRACQSDVQLAQLAWDQGSNEQAHRILERYLPQRDEPDVRNFAWWYLWKQVTEASRVLGTHPGGATAVSITPEGDLAASGGQDGLVHVWELPSGKLRWTSRENEKGPIHALKISPDGRRLASVGEDGSVRVWDLATGRSIFMHIDRDDWLAEGAWSPDGKLLATAGQKPFVKLWDGETGEPRGVFEGHLSRKAITGLAFHPREPLLISSSQDGTLRFWDLKTMKPDARLPNGLIRMERGGDWCRRIAISPDGKSFIGGTNQRELRQWSLEPGNFGGLIFKQDELSNIRAIHWPPTGGPVLGYTASGVRVADQRNLHWNESRLSRERQIIFALTSDREGTQFLAGSANGSVRIWTRGPFQRIHRKLESEISAPLNRLNIKSYFWSRSIHGLFSHPVFFDNERLNSDMKGVAPFALFDPESGQLQGFLPLTPDLEMLRLSPSGKWVVGYDIKGTVYCKSTSDLKDLWRVSIPKLATEEGMRIRLEVDPKESMVAVMNRFEVMVLSMQDGKPVQQWSFPHEINEIMIRPQLNGGKSIAFLSFDGRLLMRDLKTGMEQPELRVDGKGRCMSMAISRDGKLIAIGTIGGEAIVRRLEDLKELYRFHHGDAVFRLDFWDGDKGLITSDGPCHFWSLVDGSKLLTLPAAANLDEHEPKDNLMWDRYQGNATVSPDGERVAVPLRNDVFIIEAKHNK